MSNFKGRDFYPANLKDWADNINISLETRQKIDGYQAWKWGLVDRLPADHPYKNKPPELEERVHPTKPPNII